MKITDKYIVELFYTNNGIGPLNSQIRRKYETKSKPIVSKDIDKQIDEYLKNRYIDSESIHETLFRIKYHIEQRPHCITPGCNNKVAFNGTKKKPYMLHCCCTCTQHDKNVRDKNKCTNIKLYGCENGATSKEIKTKILNTLEKKYGKGITNVWQAKEVKEKAKQTILRKFGVDNIAKSEYSKYKHKLCEADTVVKRNITKRNRGTFNTSKPEELCYNLLVDKFGKTNVIRQYTSEFYPFNCDFYIKNKDLYIEFNGSWTHGPHPFDPLNKDDINLLKKWKLKNTKYYCIAINTWTIRDVNKRNIAKYNNINIKEFWKVSELVNFLKEI
jgi:hypothetical protein